VRSFLLGCGVAAIGPILLGILVAAGLMPGDSFWIVAPLGLLPLTGLTVGLTLRGSQRRRSPMVAAFTVPAGLALGWIIALLVTLPLDPSQDTAATLFFALISNFVLPWWFVPMMIGMGIAWWLVRRGQGHWSDVA
jgi:hypothetical protein